MADTLEMTPATTARLRVPHFIRGTYETGEDAVYRSRDLGGEFTTPALRLDRLIWPRSEPGPAFDTPIAEIVDLLVELGQRLAFDSNIYLQEAAAMSAKASPLGQRIVENTYMDIPRIFDRSALMADMEIVGAAALDGWQASERGGHHHVRAFPSRMVHVVAGNSPMVSGLTIARGALSKGVHLIKLPSNDLFTATAILRTLADIDKDHPVVRSFSAAYWPGGDERVESGIYRAQYFDKVVAWGGETSMRHIQKYIGPGLELISFDPKTSMSLIGKEAFASEETLKAVAWRASADVKVCNQDACVASRFQFIEGSVEDADRYCGHLLEALGEDSRYGDGQGPLPTAELRDHVEGVSMLEPMYRVFGRPDGRGMVIRSQAPVDFHPSDKTVNVVAVDNLRQGVLRANVATQTVGVYPNGRKAEFRDALASAGVQRVVPLGEAMESSLGRPHDAFYPLHRFVRWVADEGED